MPFPAEGAAGPDEAGGFGWARGIQEAFRLAYYLLIATLAVGEMIG